MAAPNTSLRPKARPRTKTKERTLRGRPVWIDNTGEVTGEKGAKYSEVTTTIPWGTEWITAPSIDENGERLSDDEVKERLLETRGKDFITGEELPIFSNPEKASEYAQWRSDTMFDQEAIEQGFPEEFPMEPEPERKDFIDRGIDKGKDFLEYLTTPSKHGVFNKGGDVIGPKSELERQREVNIAEQMATLPKKKDEYKPSVDPQKEEIIKKYNLDGARSGWQVGPTAFHTIYENLPTNFRLLTEFILGKDTPITMADFTKDELVSIIALSENQEKNKLNLKNRKLKDQPENVTTVTSYKLKPTHRYPDWVESNPYFRAMAHSLFSPEYQVRTTLGRYDTEDTPSSLIVKDAYDMNIGQRSLPKLGNREDLTEVLDYMRIDPEMAGEFIANVFRPNPQNSRKIDLVIPKRKKVENFNEGGDVKNQMQSMLPSADEDTRSTEEYLQHPLETVPFFQRPIGSSTKDLQIGEDDAGNPVFQTSMGNEYTVKLNPDQRTLRKKVSDAIPVVKEAVTDYIEDPKLPTKEQLSEFAKQAGQSAVESVEDLGDLMFKGEGTTGDVFGAALGAGTASIPFSVPEGAVRVFGGAGAKKIDTKIFSKAEKLWNKGTSNEEIREQTGWYKDDADRKWRFEIDDSQMKLAGEGEFDWSDPDAITYSEDIMSKAIDGGDYSSTVTLRLGDFLEHKKLFKHYPQLKDYKVILNDTSLESGTIGSFSPQDKTFSLSPQVMQDPEYAKDTLIHEIQHGIQEIEGFLPGSNVAESAYLAAKKYTDEADKISKTLESFGFNMDDRYLEQVETLADQIKNLPLTEDQKYSATKYFARLTDLDNKVQEVGQNEYKYYKNRSGEVEANLAEGRRILTPVQRANLSPIQGKQNTITDKTAYSVVDPTIKRRQGQSDILLDDVDFEYSPSTNNPRLDNFKYKDKEGDYEEMYSTRIKDFLKSDSSTRRLSTLKPGSTIKLGPDNQEYIFVRFSRDSLDKSRLNKNYPHVFHEEMGSEEFPIMATAKLIRVPKFKKERTQLIKYVQDMYNPDKEVSFPFKVKSFSLADLMFDSNKGKAKPENTGGFRDSAEENKKRIQNFLGFNKGGTVMNEQMEMAFMQEGGLKDDGMNQDPVSGNEVPSGSMASEVRDDIPAQLSEGEYVVPADVVRYFGVKHFEDLRNKAKGGLNKMEADGRIGGEPVPVGGPKADLRPDEMQEIQKMFEGGMVAGAANGGDFSFYNPTGSTTEEVVTTPTRYSGEFSFEQPGAGLATPPPEVTIPETPEQKAVTLYGPNGEVIALMLPKDQAMYDQLIAQGYGLTAPQIEKEKSSSDDDDKVQTDPNAWMDKYDYTNSGVLMQQSLDALDPKEGLEGMVGKVFGGGIFGQLSSASNAAQIAANIRLLNSQGVDTTELQTKLDTYIKTNNIGWMPDSWIDGDQLEGDVRDQIGDNLFKHGDKAYTVPETKTIMQEAQKDTVREPIKTKQVVDPVTKETKTVTTGGGSVYKPEGIDVALTPPPDKKKKKSEPSFHDQYTAAVKKSREKSEASRQAMQRAQDKGGSSKDVADLKKKYEKEGGTWASGGRARGGLMKKKKSKK